jgi:ubiquinone/menaquinone biosynthesis C-methylase UbiE
MSGWELLIDALEPAEGEKILDVGAGDGKKASRVLRASKGAEVFAIDPNEKKIAAAKRNYPVLVSSVAEAESLPFPDSYFDKVYATMSLHHFSNLDQALAEISRVLKPRGIFVILEADPRSSRGRLFSFFGRLVGERLNMMTQAQLLDRLKSGEAFKVNRTVGLGSSFLIQASRL